VINEQVEAEWEQALLEMLSIFWWNKNWNDGENILEDTLKMFGE
jgi:hypothetical protein